MTRNLWLFVFVMLVWLVVFRIRSPSVTFEPSTFRAIPILDFYKHAHINTYQPPAKFQLSCEGEYCDRFQFTRIACENQASIMAMEPIWDCTPDEPMIIDQKSSDLP